MSVRMLSLSVCAGLLLLSGASSQAQVPIAQSNAINQRSVPAVPLAFEENEGQLAPYVAYLGRAQGYSVGIERDGMIFRAIGTKSSPEVEVRFSGSQGGSPVAISGTAFRSNYFLGNNPANWHEGIPNYLRVGIREIYPGIDAEFYERSGELEHDLIVSPKGDVNAIHLAFKSARPAKLAGNGDLVFPLGDGELRFRKPLAYQYDSAGKRMIIPVAYYLAQDTVRFDVGQYDHHRTLVIDPVIAFATYISGTAGSTASQLSTDGSGSIYLAGTTSSPFSSFPASSSTSANNQGSTTSKNIFIVRLNATHLGSTVQWVTFLGGNGNSQAKAIALSSNLVYVGGQTAAGNFPGVTGSFTPAIASVSGSNSGIVASVQTSDGTLPAAPSSTYIVSDSAGPAADATVVSALATDSTGNVYIAGYGPGNSLTPMKGLGTAGSPTIPTEAGTNNAFLVELDSSLKTAGLITYVQSATSSDYKATGVQVDANGKIYVSGEIMNTAANITFPTSQSFSNTGVYTASKDFTGCDKAANDTGVFLAQIVPPSGSATNSTIGFSDLTCGNGTDHANGLALRSGGGLIYLVGDTTSTNLHSDILYSFGTTTASTSSNPPTGMQDTFAGTHVNGYAVAIGANDPVTGVPLDFTYLGGASGNTVLLDVAGNANATEVWLAGSTSAKRADMPAGTTATPLPAGQDTSSSQAAGTTRGLLYTLDSGLVGAESISYFGFANSSTEAVSTQPAGAAIGDDAAFVLVNDTVTGATGPFSFTSASGIQSTPAVGDNAYVAEVLGTGAAATPAPGLTGNFKADAGSPEINGTPCSQELACLIANDGASTITYKWDLGLPNGAAQNLVLNFPEQDLLASSGSPAYSIQVDGSSPNGTTFICSSKQNSNGTTCTLNSLAAGTSHTVTLQGTIVSTATAGNSITFDGNAADAEGEYADAPQTSVTVASPVTINLALSANQTQVDAASSASDTGGTGHVTQVTYTATVTNSGSTDSPYTTLQMTFPAGFSVIGTPSLPSGCQADGSGCKGVSVPKNSTLTYQVTGVYVGANLPSASTNTSFSETVTAHAFALPLSTSSQPADQSVATTVRGYAALSLSATSDKNTYNLSTATVPDTVTYTIRLTNNGPNESGPIAANALTNTLPQYFSVSSVTVLPAGAGTCDLANGSGCSTLNPIPGGSAVIYTVVGTFPDNGTSPDAVSQTLATAQATDTAQFSQPTATYNPTTTTSQAVTVNVQRKADIGLSTAAIVLNPAVPPCPKGSTSACVYMANTGKDVNGTAGGNGINDTTQYTVAIQNNGPNLATSAALSIPLPPGFLVAATPPVAPNPISVTTTTGLTCTPPTAMGQTLSCSGYVPVGLSTVTLTSKFADNTVPVPPPGVSSITTNPALNSLTMSAAVVNKNNVSNSIAPSQLPNVTVERAVHLVTLKYVCRSAGITNPAQPCPVAPGTVNLDEKVANDAPGKNDLVQVQVQVGNTDLDAAYGVTVTDPLPNYFTVTQLPDPTIASCTFIGPVTKDNAGNYMTGGGAVALSCNLNNPIPVGTATPGVSASSHGAMVPNSGYTQLTYYGKFQDNGLNPDIVPANTGSITLAFPQAVASSSAAALADTVNDATSPMPAAITIQRAAHLHFTLTQYVQTNDAALNPVGGVSGPGIAEAQLGANGGEVINPVRYQVRVTNDGPNIAIHPIVNTALPLNPNGAATKFVNVGQSIEPSATPGFPAAPGNCASGQICTDAGMIAAGGAISYNVDGNFDLNTLVEGNSGTRIFASTIAASSVVDSNPTATAGGDQQTSLQITVVNTPAGANFTIAPFTGSLGQPLSLKLTSVQSAGITALATASTGGPALPSGPSPNPPDNGATVPLYRYGQGGVYYTLATTANVPSAISNSAVLCLNSIPDVFQKPERVLMWVLSNAPAGTQFNPVPNYTSNGSAGDITTLVLPQGGGGYSVPALNTTYPPPPAQPQPAEVCGVINGLGTTAAPVTLALLEPVNFAPFVRSTISAANGSSQPGKGVTAAAAQVDLTISPQNNYDYNDHDPCYTGPDGTTRSSCNDNVQMTTFLFGGGNLIGETQQTRTYFYGDLQANPKPQFNMPAGQPQVYVVLADQLGAQGYKEMTSGGDTQVCDPGTPSQTYTPSTPSCPLPVPLPTGISNPPAQTILPLTNDTSVKVALVTGSVGSGGSSGLVPLPQTPTPEATANITAGQTAGFIWNWLTQLPQVQAAGANGPPVLTLACISADGTDLAAKGIQCNIPPTYTYSTGSGNNFVITAPPAIYVVTKGNTVVGTMRGSPLSRDLRTTMAVIFPIGAIPLVLLARRRKLLKLSGWLAVILLLSIAGAGIGCGSSNFQNMGGTTTTATPAATYQFVVTATGTDSSGNPINIKSYPFAVTVTSVH
jgi:uncharacterized repeat protein (TIGR01451 family)